VTLLFYVRFSHPSEIRLLNGSGLGRTRNDTMLESQHARNDRAETVRSIDENQK
jgi:hypothetical protein